METATAHNPLLLEKRAQLGAKAGVPGTLQLLSSQLRWAPDSPLAAQPVVVDVASIASQQRAKQGGTHFLRITLRGAGASSAVIFGFASEADRDDVLEMAADLRKGGASSGPGGGGGPPPLTGPPEVVKLKEKLLKEDKQLAHVYSALVFPGRCISEPEFWAPRQHLLRDAAAARKRQRTGVSGEMLQDVQVNDEGRVELVKYKLTADMIRQIFAEKPYVARAHAANVPQNMDETAFWVKYFRRQYVLAIKRQRETDGSGGVTEALDDDDDEFFSRYMEGTGLAGAAAVALPGASAGGLRRGGAAGEGARSGLPGVDPTVNLVADQADALGEGYGTAHQSGKDSGLGLRNRRPFETMVRDINAHASVVLAGYARIADASDKPGPSGAPGGDVTTEADPDQASEWRMRAAGGLDDLAGRGASQFTQLRIQDPRRVFSSRQPDAGGGRGGGGGGGGATLRQALAGLDASRLPNPPLSCGLAAQALLQTAAASGGGGDAGNAPHPARDLIAGMQDMLRSDVLAVHELLRHFWRCMPPTTAARQAKVQRIKAAMSEQYKKLTATMSVATGTEKLLVSQLLQPSVEALNAAFGEWDRSGPTGVGVS